jgi:hypothetical protein
LFFANATGLCLGWFYTLNALNLLGIAKEPHHAKQLEVVETVIICGTIYWCIACLVSFIILGPSDAERETARLIIGISSIIAALSYYAAPLSNIYDVIRNCNSISLYIPLIITNLVNAMMWVIYGAVALQDPLVYVPNGIGCVFSFVQLILAFAIPRHDKSRNDDNKDEGPVPVSSVSVSVPVVDLEALRGEHKFNYSAVENSNSSSDASKELPLENKMIDELTGTSK